MWKERGICQEGKRGGQIEGEAMKRESEEEMKKMKGEHDAAIETMKRTHDEERQEVKKEQHAHVEAMKEEVKAEHETRMEESLKICACSQLIQGAEPTTIDLCQLLWEATLVPGAVTIHEG